MSATPIPAPATRPEGPSPTGATVGKVDPAWSLSDKVGVSMAWAAGLLLCVIAAAIVLYMLYRGIQYVSADLLVEHPAKDLDQSKGGGFLDPIIGTFILTIIGIAVAAPVGVGIAVWLSEYGRPSGLARAVESGIEIVAGIPSIVLAIFGLLVFSQQAFGFLSFTAGGDAVFGRSFLIAGIMMSLIALPLIVGSTREALLAIPAHVREASYALGKDRASTIRRVLLPASRSGVATGISLGMGRIIGDTAIVVVLLGGLLLEPTSDVPVVGTLTGTGGTLTSYVYNNSPTGEGNAPDKAYAAAFVLLIVVIILNFLVDRISRRRKAEWTT
ncbi:MAG: ABC transporter permease subunit [Solirubrobacterales bacterium]|nr:ABC transporter permease subunit [Solirubrobacterales bacterium]